MHSTAYASKSVYRHPIIRSHNHTHTQTCDPNNADSKNINIHTYVYAHTYINFHAHKHSLLTFHPLQSTSDPVQTRDTHKHIKHINYTSFLSCFFSLTHAHTHKRARVHSHGSLRCFCSMTYSVKLMKASLRDSRKIQWSKMPVRDPFV